MRFLAAFLLALLLASAAWAQKQVVPPPGLSDAPPPPPGLPPPPPPGGVTVAPDGRLIVSSTVCDRLKEVEVPGADYTPGVDARGEPVAPADLPGSAPPMKANNVAIEIDANMRKRFGVGAGSPLFRSKAIVGYVTLQGGQALFNGEPIGGNERDMILAACRTAKRQ